MSTLPGELVLLNPWRPRPPVDEPIKRKRLSQEIKVSSHSREPGSGSARVQWGEDAMVHVCVSPPSQPLQSTSSHDHAVLEMNLVLAPFATRHSEFAVPEAEISRLTREALALVMDVNAYPKSVITFRVVILSAEPTLRHILPAVILGATAAVEAADLAVVGRVLATRSEQGVTGFELKTNRLAILHCPAGVPELGPSLSAALQLEEDLIAAGAIKPRFK